MHPRWNTFSKMVVLIVLFILPVVMIYSYTNYVSVNTIRQELEDKSLSRLSFFTSQIDNIVDQLSTLSIIVSKDSSVKKLGEAVALASSFQQLEAQEEVIQKLGLLSVTSSWKNSLIIYLPKTKQVISNDYLSVYDDGYLQEQTVRSWSYHPAGSEQDGYFSKMLWSPLLMNRSLLEADAVVEVRFRESNMIRMLNDYKNEEKNANSFFYKKGFAPIRDERAQAHLAERIASLLDNQELGKSGNQTLDVGTESYLISFAQSKSLEWYAVDYQPLEQVLTPIKKSRNLFYVAMVFVLLFELLAIVLLYNQVQKPILLLLRGVQKIQTGSYSYRLSYRPRNEFDYLFTKFNEMTDEIQRLIEKVYLENIRFREAKLKHLQSQINPHFLANSLLFVKNMIAIQDDQAATKMILKLAEYFRYITKLEHTLSTLEEEIKLVENYLTIQNLRIQRFHYTINIPDSMLPLLVPRLMIQPIVENTIIHGIEKSLNYGIIQITGEEEDGTYRIIIDDSGDGMSAEGIHELQTRMTEPLDQEGSCGLWNVHQRLFYQYDLHSGLTFEASPLGGLRVTITWRQSV
ncbi:sensor histidine kinase [Paenibacillus periandrae]|uniref:sensor histidine kinase n=1 Tax=Paenibacillus periandrae TaxID=1761741 RepID=UPI001F09F1A5|nr:histidine kinase [Paenibacillus periandrae]